MPADSSHQDHARPRAPVARGRRSDLDWLRIFAFSLLILYHIALFFGPWEWHINSRHQQRWIASLLVMTNPWRLGLLFFVSGAATRLLGARLSTRQLLVERSWRLLIPLVAGVLLLVPPQAYIEAVAKDGETRDYLAFLHDYFLPGGVPRLIPPLNHLWFIGYIWAYSIIAALILPWAAQAEAPLARLLRRGRIMLAPIAYLALVRIALFPIFGITNKLSWDWYNHASSFGLFMLGFLLVHQRSFWQSLQTWRWASLGLALLSLIPLMIDAALPPPQHARWTSIMFCFAVNQWSAIAAAAGFAHRHLSGRSGPILGYLRQGIFPFYLVHQTLIVAIASWLDRAALPILAEAIALLGLTLLGCIASYEAVRRVPGLRQMLGLRPGQPLNHPAHHRILSVEALPRPPGCEAPSATAQQPIEEIHHR